MCVLIQALSRKCEVIDKLSLLMIVKGCDVRGGSVCVCGREDVGDYVGC